MTTAEGQRAMLRIARNCELMAERMERLAARKLMDGAEKTGRVMPRLRPQPVQVDWR